MKCFTNMFSSLSSPGPVTVPMVSQSGSPPIPMPGIQVPPGHVMQQIVDENGTLRHVILSTQHQQLQSGVQGVQHHIHGHYVSWRILFRLWNVQNHLELCHSIEFTWNCITSVLAIPTATVCYSHALLPSASHYAFSWREKKATNSLEHRLCPLCCNKRQAGASKKCVVKRCTSRMCCTSWDDKNANDELWAAWGREVRPYNVAIASGGCWSCDKCLLKDGGSRLLAD